MIAILRREILIGLRRGAPYALLAANALVLAGLAAAVGALAGTVSPWTAPAIGATTAVSPTGIVPTLVAWRGPALFFLLTAWLALLATVVAPTIGARLLTFERRAGTLDGLIGSGVPAGALVLAKLVAGCVQIWLALLSGAPAFAMVWLFGGVPASVVLLAFGFLAAYVLFLVALGMLAGALAGGDVLPAGLGAFAGLALLVATLVGFLVIAGVGRAGGPAFAAANPLVSLLVANREMAEALARVVPNTFAMPMRPSFDLLGREIAGPLPFMAGLGYGLLALALVPLIAAALDPYHPIKTLRLRRSAA